MFHVEQEHFERVICRKVGKPRDSFTVGAGQAEGSAQASVTIEGSRLTPTPGQVDGQSNSAKGSKRNF